MAGHSTCFELPVVWCLNLWTKEVYACQTFPLWDAEFKISAITSVFSNTLCSLLWS